MGMGNRGCNEHGAASSVDLDTCLNVLSSRPCRYLLRQLSDRSDHVAYFDELIDEYVSGVDEADRKRLEIRCHHHHLPALEDAGLVEFDEKSGAVRYYPDEKVEELLNVTAPWEE